MAEKRDYYDILGVDKNASEADIKKAYRKLAKQYHPDVNQGDKSAEGKFKEVSEAYDVLGNAEKKSRYDQYGHAGTDPNFGGGGFGGGFDGFDVGDIFESFFGGGFGRGSSRSKNGPKRGADLRVAIEITFEQAAFGLEKEIALNRLHACDTCKGSGCKPGKEPIVCKHCNGTGQVQVKQTTPFGQFVNVKTCDVCGGEGRIITDPCTTCGGKGKVRKNTKIKVNIPAGIDDGQAISLRGEGEPGTKGGPAGDLLINIRVRPHTLFKRQGNDVVCDMPITFVQAALGAEVEVPTLDGKVRYTVPEGTQTGSVFRIKGRGIPYIRGNGRGDHFVKVFVEVPKKLNDKQKEALKNFAELSGDEVHEQRRGFFDKMKGALGK